MDRVRPRGGSPRRLQVASASADRVPELPDTPDPTLTNAPYRHGEVLNLEPLPTEPAAAGGCALTLVPAAALAPASATRAVDACDGVSPETHSGAIRTQAPGARAPGCVPAVPAAVATPACTGEGPGAGTGGTQCREEVRLGSEMSQMCNMHFMRNNAF